jgi:hypothetical protein
MRPVSHPEQRVSMSARTRHLPCGAAANDVNDTMILVDIEPEITLATGGDGSGLGPDDLPGRIAKSVAVSVPADDAWSAVKADARLIPQDHDLRAAQNRHIGDRLEHLIVKLARIDRAEVVGLRHLRAVRGDKPVVLGMQWVGRQDIRSD